ncbi:MAG: hypothetical protein MJ200_05710 [Mycoplasmoidaceae bacterium]|nr:hypothetical protein [Mycoplasmoidaceae bacterium]
MKKFILSVLTATPLFVTPLISLTSCGEQKEKIMVTIQTNEGGEVKTSSIRVNHGSIFKDIKKRLEKCVEAKYTYRLEK